MADDKKKPKIDLKARLGKASPGGAAPGGGLVPAPLPPGPTGSTPPPPVASADGTPLPAPPVRNIAPPASIRPSGIAPPAGITGGISLPSFQRPTAPKKEVVSAEAQTIKVEIGEEIIEQRKASRRNAIIAAFVGALFGIGIGFVAGGRSEASKNSNAAIKNSSDLQKEVDGAAKKLKELDQMLYDLVDANGASPLDNENYPKDLSQKLATITIQFDDSKISGPAIASLPGKVVKSLLAFKQACDNIQDKKEALKNMLTDKTQADLEKAWAEVKKPAFKNAVTFKGGGEKTFAELVNLKDSFAPADSTWPKEFKITVQEPQPDGSSKDVDKTVTLWIKGDLTGIENKTMGIPLDPGHGARNVVSNLVGPLKAQVGSIRRLIYGDNTPGREVKGLLKQDENTKGLQDELDAALSDISLK